MDDDPAAAGRSQARIDLHQRLACARRGADQGFRWGFRSAALPSRWRSRGKDPVRWSRRECLAYRRSHHAAECRVGPAACQWHHRRRWRDRLAGTDASRRYSPCRKRGDGGVPSRSRPDRGLATIVSKTLNQRGDVLHPDRQAGRLSPACKLKGSFRSVQR